MATPLSQNTRRSRPSAFSMRPNRWPSDAACSTKPFQRPRLAGLDLLPLGTCAACLPEQSLDGGRQRRDGIRDGGEPVVMVGERVGDPLQRAVQGSEVGADGDRRLLVGFIVSGGKAGNGGPRFPYRLHHLRVTRRIVLAVPVEPFR